MKESTIHHWLLAIDTSTEQAGLALTDGARTGELSWPGGRTQTESVLGQLDHLRRLLRVPMPDIRAIGVATGPGTFTGLRVGLSLAKGLALSGRLPIIGVPTLDAAAAPYAQGDTSVAVVLAAGRGRVVWALYGRLDPTRTTDSLPRNTTFAQFLDALAGQREILVTGELTAEQRELLREAGHERIEAPALQNRRPGAVAAIAWERWQAGDVDDLTALEPFYLHGITRTAPATRERMQAGR